MQTLHQRSKILLGVRPHAEWSRHRSAGKEVPRASWAGLRSPGDPPGSGEGAGPIRRISSLVFRSHLDAKTSSPWGPAPCRPLRAGRLHDWVGNNRPRLAPVGFGMSGWRGRGHGFRITVPWLGFRLCRVFMVRHKWEKRAKMLAMHRQGAPKSQEMAPGYPHLGCRHTKIVDDRFAGFGSRGVLCRIGRQGRAGLGREIGFTLIPCLEGLQCEKAGQICLRVLSTGRHRLPLPMRIAAVVPTADGCVSSLWKTGGCSMRPV